MTKPAASAAGQVNTGLPAFKIGLESVGGSVVGGIVVYAIVYAGKQLD